MTAPASNLEQVRPDPAFIVAHGARSLIVTTVAIIMTIASLAIAPHERLPWFFVPVTYALLAGITHLKCRAFASGGVPPGAWGDSRFMLAVVAAVGLAATPTEAPNIAVVPLILLTTAVALCGAADGAWTATAMRYMKLSLVKALVLFVRAIRSGEATGWPIVAGGRP